jgi:hypothetical protein
VEGNWGHYGQPRSRRMVPHAEFNGCGLKWGRSAAVYCITGNCNILNFAMRSISAGPERGNGDIVRYLAERRDMHYHQYGPPEGASAYGVSILSRYEIKVSPHPMWCPCTRCVYIVSLQTLFGVFWDRRCWIWFMIFRTCAGHACVLPQIS